jgi:hypothetical protein
VSRVETLLEAQTAALLRRLAREQDSRVRLIREEAAAQAADIVRKARAEARMRVHQAALDTRREDERSSARRLAALATGVRKSRQAALRDWLESAWLALPGVLQARWLEPPPRAQWCAAALQSALRDLLHHDRLQVEVDAHWAAEIEPLVHERLANACTVTLVPLTGLGEGLRIRAGQAVVDATIAGLLVPRERIAAELLAEFGRHVVTKQPEATT